MTATPTIEARLAEVLCDCDRRNGDHGDCWASCAAIVRSHQILPLIHTLLREERERCAVECDHYGSSYFAAKVRNLGDRE